MKKGAINTKTGFTIIEVSLVLAIAGLVLMMVFIALPALQRNARDAQRREDINEFVSAVKKYQSNNRGALPDRDGENSWQGFGSKYIEDYGDKPEESSFTDPSSNTRYNIVVTKCGGNTDGNCSFEEGSPLDGSFDDHLGNIYVVTEARCSGDESTGAKGASNPRHYAVLYRLESGGLYCQDA